MNRDRSSKMATDNAAQQRSEEIRSAAYFWGGQAADGMRSLDWNGRFEVFDAALDSAVDGLPGNLSDQELEFVAQTVARTALDELGNSTAVTHSLQAALLGMSSCPVHRLAAAAWSAAHPRMAADLPTLMRPSVLPMMG